jgi:hypothetical protein
MPTGKIDNVVDEIVNLVVVLRNADARDADA